MNSLSKFLSRRMGKRFYNYAYCWGACLVILGAIFKIVHLPYDNLMLLTGMGVEVFIFFISGFEEPAREYKWERVFPELEKDYQPDLSSAAHVKDAVYTEKLNRINGNIEKLNTVYEMHIEGVKQQAEAIQGLNSSLVRLKGMYEKSIGDNESFSVETEKMTKQVNALNHQYSRILTAMNVKTEQ